MFKTLKAVKTLLLWTHVSLQEAEVRLIQSEVRKAK